MLSELLDLKDFQSGIKQIFFAGFRFLKTIGKQQDCGFVGG